MQFRAMNKYHTIHVNYSHQLGKFVGRVVDQNNETRHEFAGTVYWVMSNLSMYAYANLNESYIIDKVQTLSPRHAEQPSALLKMCTTLWTGVQEAAIE